MNACLKYKDQESKNQISSWIFRNVIIRYSIRQALSYV